MAGISSKAFNTLENKYKFNAGTELNTDFDLNIYETPLRGYDAQIGRFGQIDMLADAYDFISPYQFGLNNPIAFNDPTGALTDRQIQKIEDGLNNSGHGGTWTPEGGFTPFNSGAQAFEAGAIYLSNNNLWGTNGFASSFESAQAAYGKTKGADPEAQKMFAPIIVRGNVKNGNWVTKSVEYPKIAGYLDGNFSTQDLINIGLCFVGSGLQTMEMLVRNERNIAYAANIAKGMKRPLTSEIANLDRAAENLGKYGRRIGVAGIAASALNLTYKYFNDGITRKDVLNTTVSLVLMSISVTNPVALGFLVGYSVLDGLELLDVLKEAVHADDTILFKY